MYYHEQYGLAQTETVSSSRMSALFSTGVIFLVIIHVNGTPASRSSSRGLAAGCGPIDFSYPFDENTIYFIGVQPFRFTRKTINDPPPGDDGDIFYTANEFEAGEHGGTHLDAPYHFYKEGWKIGDIPIDRLISVNGIVIDMRREAELNPDYALTADKLSEWEKKLTSPIEKPTLIIINFGWAKKYPNKNDYYGSKTLNISDLHFPGISKEAADWIANNEKVVGVGLDTPSADSGRNSPNPVAHISINRANKYILENMELGVVDNLTDDSRFTMTISPMKIREGSGAPCRIFAYPQDNDCHYQV